MTEKSGRIRIVGYVRVSTLEQARQGESLGTQRERIRRYLDLTDAELVFTISDDGVSGKTMDRPGFQKVLQMLRDDEADGVCVSRLDRMTRRVRHLIEFGVGVCGLVKMSHLTEALKKAADTWRRGKLTPFVKKVFDTWFRILG